MMERLAPCGRPPEDSTQESLAAIGADYGLSRITVNKMLTRARKHGFAAYPLKSEIEFGGYPE